MGARWKEPEINIEYNETMEYVCKSDDVHDDECEMLMSSVNHEVGKEPEYDADVAARTIYTVYYDSETDELVREDGPLPPEKVPARWSFSRKI